MSKNKRMRKITWEVEPRNTRSLITLFLGLEDNESKTNSNKCIGSLMIPREDTEAFEYGLSKLAEGIISFNEEGSPRKISG